MNTLSTTHDVSTAADPTTPSEILLEIVHSGNALLVTKVAGNRAVPAEVLDQILEGRPSEATLTQIATNPAAGAAQLAQVLEQLTSGNLRLLSKVVSNPNVDPATLAAYTPMNLAPTSFRDATPNLEAMLNPSTPIRAVASSLKLLRDPANKRKVVGRRRGELLALLADEYGSAPTATPSDLELVKLVETHAS